MKNQIVILAAGKGTRMGDSDIPKVLVMLKNKPLILYILEEIEKVHQLAKPVVVVGYKQEQVRAILGDGFTYAFQQQQLGTAHALLAALPRVSADNVLVLYGDMPFIKAGSLKEIIQLHQANHATLSMFTATVPNFDNEFASLNHYGRIIRNQNTIVKITEFKDATETERQIKEVNPGIYMLNTQWVKDSLSKVSNNNIQHEYYLTDIVEIAIQQNKQVFSFAINPKEVIGINSREELQKAESLV